ncbi:hypothetical protein V3C99_011723, partial [Haemonchus contortus]
SALLLAPSILLLCDVVAAQYSCNEQNGFSVTIWRSEQDKKGYASSAINFYQMGIDPYITDIYGYKHPGINCYANLCRMPLYNKDDCLDTFMPVLQDYTGCTHPGNLQIPENFTGKAHAAVYCYNIYTNELVFGTEWIPIFIPEELVASIKEEVETEQKPVVQPTVKDASITMKVTAVVRIQLTWDIEMRNGDPFNPSVLKSITIKRHHQISADDYDDGIVISNDINKHVIDDGLSPGYNFRWTCYLYSIDVTFQNGRHAYKEVERCFSLFSPSFVFLLGAISISIVLCIQFKAVATEDTEHTQRALRRFRRLRI